MARFSKFKLLFTFKLNFNGAQFYTEVSKFGYFKKSKQVRTQGRLSLSKCLINKSKIAQFMM